MDKKGGGLYERILETVRKLSPPRDTVQHLTPPVNEPGAPGDIQTELHKPVSPRPGEPQEMAWLSQADTVSTIRRAAKRRILLNMEYNGVTRYVEAYSFRPGKHGVLFYGYCLTHNEIHSFYIHRIGKVEVTDIPFSPRWAVEL